jgi:DNA (cytosine-5)-methyltransferase 1
LITYSSPCQDFSVAGLQKGGDAGSGTRSSLLWECERIIRAVKPKYLLMENVKNLVGKKHIHNFIRWLQVLEMMGYQNYWQVLNAKDYGVPQNRERVFVVSILGCGQYLFPNPIKLEKRLKDVLEPVVDEKYYLTNKLIEGFLKRTEQQKQIKGGYIFQPSTGDCVSKTITGRNGNRITDNYICIGGMQEHQSITTDGVSTCLCSSMGQGGGYVPMIIASRKRENGQELELNESGCSNALTSVQKDNLVAEPSIIEEPYNLYPNSGNPQAGRVYNPNGISPAMDTCSGGNRMPKITESYRIRKLTPRECWRLMGVKDEQFDKLHGISNSQLYKLAGNSIVVDVLMGIFKNLLISDEGTKGQLTLL